MASSLDSKALAKLNFEKHVSAAFRKLVKRGFHPNLAAAYAVMLVSTGVLKFSAHHNHFLLRTATTSLAKRRRSLSTRLLL